MNAFLGIYHHGLQKFFSLFAILIYAPVMSQSHFSALLHNKADIEHYINV